MHRHRSYPMQDWRRPTAPYVSRPLTPPRLQVSPGAFHRRHSGRAKAQTPHRSPPSLRTSVESGWTRTPLDVTSEIRVAAVKQVAMLLC
eukprot:3145638-Pyramimonas_sp.AAC.1